MTGREPTGNASLKVTASKGREARGVVRSLTGSANRGNIRTFLSFEVAIKVNCNKKPALGEKRHRFDWEHIPAHCEPLVLPASPRRNPVHPAREWQAMIEGHGESRADLARRLGVSRPRVTQILSVLELGPDALELLEQQTAPGMVSERALRGLRRLDAQSQRDRVAMLLTSRELIRSPR